MSALQCKECCFSCCLHNSTIKWFVANALSAISIIYSKVNFHWDRSWQREKITPRQTEKNGWKIYTYLISVIVDHLKLCLQLCLFKFMDPNKETFSVYLLHAKRSIACVAWRFKQFERAARSAKTSGKGFAARFVWRLCSAKFCADQMIQICTSGDKNDFWQLRRRILTPITLHALIRDSQA